ncbi:MAG: DNA translocase FtsK 4TM domain-containing protein [Anaerovoracaceae bacterium]
MAVKKNDKKTDTSSSRKSLSSVGKNASYANKKKTSASAKSNVKGKSKEEKEKEIQASLDKIYRKKRLLDELIAVCMVAAGIFLILSVMTDVTGKFGAILSMTLKGIFGLGAYILPFYVIIYSLFVLMNYMAHLNGRTVFFSLLMFVDICMLNSARFPAVHQELFSINFIKESFTAGVNLDSGGVIGMFLAWLLVKFVAVAGLIIIGILIMIISIMLIVNTPISVFLENRRKKRIEKQLKKQQEEDEIQETEISQEAYADSVLPAVHLAKTESKGRTDYEAPPKGAAAAETALPSFIENVKTADVEAEGADKRTNQRIIMEYMNDDSMFASGMAGEPDSDTVKSDVSFLHGYLPHKGDEAPSMKRTKASVEAEPLQSETVQEPSPENSGVNEGDADARIMTRSEAKAAIAAGAEALNSEIKIDEGDTHYELPPTSLLRSVTHNYSENEEAELAEKASRLEKVLHDFGVNAHVKDVQKGPSVTRYEIQPDTGVKVNSIVRLSDDIALNLEAKSLRIEAPIPGKAAVGIEVENDVSDLVTLKEMIESDAFRKTKSKISFVVGEDIAGNSIVGDLKDMPHLLIAGSTGSGKSVCINSIIMSILYNATPDEVKLILIDPKVVELGNYNGIPHMLIPVVTDPTKAAAALAWAVQEMNSRYKKFAEKGVRDLKAYNEKLSVEGEDFKPLPQIVIIIDELADLMMAAAKQVEESICRLAQLARAAGMHLVVATQRPSVDVVTGLIKANIPSRIAFAVSSQVDSRTILDRAGAEKLVGKGDMLYYPLGKAQPMRLQGPFVTDDEVGSVIEFWKSQMDENADKEAAKAILNEIETVDTGFTEDSDDEDELMNDAIELVLNANQASASMLQRRFRIGYNRAGRLIDLMEARGIIGASEGSKPRKVLISKADYELRLNSEQNKIKDINSLKAEPSTSIEEINEGNDDLEKEMSHEQEVNDEGIY